MSQVTLDQVNDAISQYYREQEEHRQLYFLGEENYQQVQPNVYQAYYPRPSDIPLEQNWNPKAVFDLHSMTMRAPGKGNTTLRYWIPSVDQVIIDRPVKCIQDKIHQITYCRSLTPEGYNFYTESQVINAPSSYNLYETSTILLSNTAEERLLFSGRVSTDHVASAHPLIRWMLEMIILGNVEPKKLLQELSLRLERIGLELDLSEIKLIQMHSGSGYEFEFKGEVLTASGFLVRLQTVLDRMSRPGANAGM